jgi:transcriptional regulator with XRE-family HTH domain
MAVKKSFIMDIDNFDKRMLAIRKQKNLSQKSFSDLIGASTGYIGIVEQGKRKPSFNFIMSVLKTTQVSADWLLLGKGSMYPPIKEKKEEIKEINEDRAAYGGNKSSGGDDVFDILKSDWDSLNDDQKRILVGIIKGMVENNVIKKENNMIKEFISKLAASRPGELLQVPSSLES